MNRTIFWRLFWKEYRAQRALWIAMAVLTAFLLWLTFEFSLNPYEGSLALYRLAVAFPALYALGCGAMLFAGEREAETYEFLRSLPLSPWHVFASKIAAALLAVVSLHCLTWLLAAWLNDWKLPNAHERLLLWTTFGLFGLEMFLWATLFSLLLKRVLVAAILGVAAASVGAFVMVVSVSNTPAIVMDMYVTAMPRRAALAALVALADIWLAGRWFKPRAGRPNRSASPAVDADLPAAAAAFSRPFLAPRRMTIFGRLLWQHWRQTRWLTATILGTVIVALILVLTGIGWGPNGPLEADRPNEAVSGGLGAVLLLMGIPLLGLCAFHADQWRRGYRFLADRGVSPKYVWLSRQTIAFGPPLLVLAALMLVAVILATKLLLLMKSLDVHRTYGAPPLDMYAAALVFAESVFTVAGFVVLAIAVGQLASMFLRSGLLAGLLCIVLTYLLAGWSAVMWIWHASWLWSVLPIPLVLLLASRLRTRYWLLERNTLRAWLPPILVLLAPAAAILTAVPLYRVYSVPVVDPGISLEEYDRPLTPEEKLALDAYLHACFQSSQQGFEALNTLNKAQYGAALMPSEVHALEAEWVKQNEAVIDGVMYASKLPLSARVVERLPQFQTAYLAELLICSATQLEEQGKLDAAMEQYLAAIKIAVELHAWYPIEGPTNAYDLCRGDVLELEAYARLPRWAGRPGQTPERILAAARQLEKLTSDVPISDGIKAAHCSVRRFLLGDVNAINRTEISNPTPVPTITLVWLRLPWERARALRLLDRVTRTQLAVLATADGEARSGGIIHQPPPPPEEGAGRWSQEFDFPYALQNQVYVPPVCYAHPWEALGLVRNYAAIETSRRATRLLLALEAWKLRHGVLPKTLDELVGPCLDRLPLDPYTGEPFHYFREGLKTPFEWHQPTLSSLLTYSDHRGLAWGRVDADKPFLWSTGAKIIREPQNGEGALDSYQIYQDAAFHLAWGDPRRELRWPTSEVDVWSSGWPFAIP